MQNCGSKTELLDLATPRYSEVGFGGGVSVEGGKKSCFFALKNAFFFDKLTAGG